MKIEVIQIENEMNNLFEITYNNKLKYRAKLPFIAINDPLNIEKVRKIKINDINDNEIYRTEYKYVENLKEEFIPLKYLVSGSQKFNQLLFISNKDIIKIYYEANEIWSNRYVIEINGKKYFCYSIKDGYVRHFPIYDEGKQVGEILKSNVKVNDKDEYTCYLKEENHILADGIVALLLYLDRSEYSSSYIINKSYNLTKTYTYNKTNKFYDKNWVINNFGDEFYKKVENDVNLVKEKLKNPMKSSKELLGSLSKKEKAIIKFILIGPWILMAIACVIILLVGLFK